MYNAVAQDTSTIALIDKNVTFLPGSTGGVITGGFSAILQAGVNGRDFTPADTTLSQTGMVPLTAQSLRFRAYGTYSIGPLLVFLGGQRLNLSPLASGVNYTVFGGDIHAWQGLVAQLDFTVLAGRPHVDNNNVTLDSINFSDVPIPEPGVFGLLVLGAFIFGWRLFSKSRS